MAAAEVRHITKLVLLAALESDNPFLCGAAVGEEGYTVSLRLCPACEEAEALGAPQVPLFPLPVGEDWHIRDITGRLYCGAYTERFGLDVRSISDAIPICKPCRVVFRDMKVRATA